MRSGGPSTRAVGLRAWVNASASPSTLRAPERAVGRDGQRERGSSRTDRTAVRGISTRTAARSTSTPCVLQGFLTARRSSGAIERSGSSAVRLAATARTRCSTRGLHRRRLRVSRSRRARLWPPRARLQPRRWRALRTMPRRPRPEPIPRYRDMPVGHLVHWLGLVVAPDVAGRLAADRVPEIEQLAVEYAAQIGHREAVGTRRGDRRLDRRLPVARARRARSGRDPCDIAR